jgi:hypothetical protein
MCFMLYCPLIFVFKIAYLLYLLLFKSTTLFLLEMFYIAAHTSSHNLRCSCVLYSLTFSVLDGHKVQNIENYANHILHLEF